MCATQQRGRCQVRGDTMGSPMTKLSLPDLPERVLELSTRPQPWPLMSVLEGPVLARILLSHLPLLLLLIKFLIPTLDAQAHLRQDPVGPVWQ